MGLPTNRIHQITCQTCHWPTKAGGGSEHIARLRKDPDELCATCHHMRYTYGDNPPSTISSTQFGKPNNWSVLPLNDSGFPKLLTPVTTVTGMASITNPTAPSLEMKFWGANTQAIMKNAAGQASAGYAIYNLIYRGQLGGTTANPSGGNYPHDSPQYDLFRGKTGGTLVEFTKDLKGNTLTYNDSRPYNKDNACIVCHVRPEPEKGKFGHTFQGQEEGALEIYGPTFNQAQTEADVAALLATLHNMLDADDDGTLLWTRATKDADLKKALSSATGLTNASKLIMHGVAWNFFTIEGDSSEGIHNPEYAKSILNNCITIMNQLKDPTVSPDSAKITWY